MAEAKAKKTKVTLTRPAFIDGKLEATKKEVSVDADVLADLQAQNAIEVDAPTAEAGNE